MQRQRTNNRLTTLLYGKKHFLSNWRYSRCIGFLLAEQVVNKMPLTQGWQEINCSVMWIFFLLGGTSRQTEDRLAQPECFFFFFF